MKKTLTMVLALVLCLALAAPALADSSNFNADGEYPLFKDKVTLTIGVKQHANVEDWNTNWQTLYLEELANVDLQFEVYASEMNTQITLAITGGTELPDILFTSPSLDLLYQWALAGAVIPLGDYYDNYAYYINDAIKRTGVDFKPLVTSPDGEIYTLPTFNQSLTNEAPDKIWIYQPWLDALNMKAPTNAEELYEVLKAFKEKDPNGNGEADEIPLMSATNITTKDAWWRAIMNMYLYVPNIPQSVKDGKVFYYAATDEYREGLKFIRKLIDEGLVDPMTFTADKTQFTALINGETNVVGMTMDMIPYGNANTPRIAEFTGLEPFTGVDGVKRTTFAPSLPVVSAMITSSCEDPEAAFRFLDLLYRQDMSIINHWGEEGKHWAWAEETDVSPYANMGYEASFREIEPLWGTVQNIMWYQTGPYAREYFIASGRVLPDNPLTTGARAATIQWAYTPCYPAEGEYIPRFIYTEEESDEISLTLTDLSTYIATARTNFMMNAEGMDIYSDECWNAYLAQLDTIGLQEVLPILQEVYDRMYGE
ncbi:MAG: extracellular solute-binding protein [Clostridiales bacterium]|nr:extracellular solute-binding protein [Clostridiales bacterium]